MSNVTANQYRTNVLFRVLAFLDNTATQSFILQDEVTADGHFKNPDAVFGEGTAISSILAASLRALRANVRRLFQNTEEQHALLTFMGTGEVSRAANTWNCATWIAEPAHDNASSSAEETAQAEAPSPQAADETGIFDKADRLPLDTTWSFLLCHPTSLLHYAEEVEGEVPYHLLIRLREVLGVSTTAPSAVAAPLLGEEGSPEDADNAHHRAASTAPSSFSTTPLVEQLLIDGLDEWLRGCPVEEVKRIILACGVQPTVLASAFDASQCAPPNGNSAPPLPDSLVDFVVDVVFPVAPASSSSAASSAAATQSTQTSTTPAEAPLDWLLLSYEKNRESVEVGEEDGDDSDDAEADEAESDHDGAHRTLSGESNRSAGPRRKVARAEAAARSSQKSLDADDEGDSLGAWQPEDGEEVLTADNIDRYLRECPQRIPKEILREKRKSITDASITDFELENHYTAAELKKLVKDKIGAMTAEEATEYMRGPVSDAQVHQAAKATRKAQFVEWIITTHRAGASVAPQHN